MTIISVFRAYKTLWGLVHYNNIYFCIVCFVLYVLPTRQHNSSHTFVTNDAMCGRLSLWSSRR